MAKTSIEWTDFSINPIRARWKKSQTEGYADIIQGKRQQSGHYCEKISPGCKNCYASRFQPRFGMPTFDEAIAKRDDIEVYLDESKLQQVLCRKKPTTYFWCDMSDIFGDWVPDEWIDKCFATAALTPQHTHMFLTKRADRMKNYVGRSAKSIKPLEVAARDMGYTFNFEGISLLPFPISSIWLGVSAENDEWLKKRWPYLRDTPAAVRFISYEPALGPINIRDVCLELPRTFYPAQRGLPYGAIGERDSKPDWVIAGGESGPGARPADPEWFRSVRDACVVSGVAFFMKQITKGGKKIPFSQWPEDLKVREFPNAYGERLMETGGTVQ